MNGSTPQTVASTVGRTAVFTDVTTRRFFGPLPDRSYPYTISATA